MSSPDSEYMRPTMRPPPVAASSMTTPFLGTVSSGSSSRSFSVGVLVSAAVSTPSISRKTTEEPQHEIDEFHCQQRKVNMAEDVTEERSPLKRGPGWPRKNPPPAPRPKRGPGRPKKKRGGPGRRKKIRSINASDSADVVLELENTEKEKNMLEGGLQGAERQAQAEADEIAKLMTENKQLKFVIEDLKRKSNEAEIESLREEFHQRVATLERKIRELEEEKKGLIIKLQAVSREDMLRRGIEDLQRRYQASMESIRDSLDEEFVKITARLYMNFVDVTV